MVYSTFHVARAIYKLLLLWVCLDFIWNIPSFSQNYFDNTCKDEIIKHSRKHEVSYLQPIDALITFILILNLLLFMRWLAECVPILATSIWLIILLHEPKSTSESNLISSWFNQSGSTLVPLIFYSWFCWLVDHSNGYETNLPFIVLLTRCPTVKNQWCEIGHRDLLHNKD